MAWDEILPIKKEKTNVEREPFAQNTVQSWSVNLL